jgi:molybdate transport system ATP-binding protein
MPESARKALDGALRVDLYQSGPIPLAAQFTCAAGELLALVGPSGSGKTTILRTIAGLYHPAQGSVRCADVQWFDTETRINLTPQQRSVGLVFQDYALFPNLSVRDNVQIALGHLPKDQHGARVKELLELVNLNGLESRRPHRLSGGQQQRVAIARALARDPKVLLLDEPFSAVDQVTRRKLREELAQLRSTLKIPVVLVTHDLEEAAMLSDQLTILHHGKSLQQGPAHEVFSHPNSVQVARLVDLPNVYEATVIGHDSDLQSTELNWQGITIQARLQAEYDVAQHVAWAIPGSGIILHRRDRPSRGERENPVHGTVSNLIPLGDMCNLTMVVNNELKSALTLQIPTHVAQRNTLAIGVDISVSLRAEAVQIMPVEAT